MLYYILFYLDPSHYLELEERRFLIGGRSLSHMLARSNPLPTQAFINLRA